MSSVDSLEREYIPLHQQYSCTAQSLLNVFILTPVLQLLAALCRPGARDDDKLDPGRAQAGNFVDRGCGDGPLLGGMQPSSAEGGPSTWVRCLHVPTRLPLADAGVMRSSSPPLRSTSIGSCMMVLAWGC